MSAKNLLRCAAEPTHQRVRQLIKKVPETVKDLLLLIRDHYCDSENRIFQLQREAGLSDWDLKLFHRELGITPGQLRLAMRLETAAVLFLDTSLSLKVIAELVGYESERGLRRLFDKWTGLAPSVVRRYLCRLAPEQRALVAGALQLVFLGAAPPRRARRRRLPRRPRLLQDPNRSFLRKNSQLTGTNSRSGAQNRPRFWSHKLTMGTKLTSILVP